MDNNHVNHGNEYTVSQRFMELVVAAMFLGTGALVMYDNYRIGAGWASDGPQAGYFPFYMGLIMFFSAGVIFIQNLVTKHPDLNTFVERTQLKSVLQVLLPSIVLVIAIEFLGLYVSAAIFIAFFMIYLGKYPVWKAALIGIAVPVALFILFETQFLVPLPKGPLEAALGY
jgi:putative tricarboxylic transport membrane protein